MKYMSHGKELFFDKYRLINTVVTFIMKIHLMKRWYWISVLTIYFKIIYLKILDMILLVISFYLVKKLAIVLAYISIFF